MIWQIARQIVQKITFRDLLTPVFDWLILNLIKISLGQ